MLRFIFLITLVFLTTFPGKVLAQNEVATFCVRGTISTPLQGQWLVEDGAKLVDVSTAVYSFQLQFYAEPPPSTRVGRADFRATLISGAVSGADLLLSKDSEGKISAGQILRKKIETTLKGERFRCKCADRFFAQEENLTFRFMFGHLFSMNFFGYTWNSPDAIQEYPNYPGQTLPERGDLNSVAAQVTAGQCASNEYLKQ